MDRAAIDAAGEALAAAWKSGTHIEQLPEGSWPQSAEEAFAIQDAMIARLELKVAGFKVGRTAGEQWLVGAILEPRLFASGAKVPAQLASLRGVECEIAFRFDRDLPPRPTDYTYDEVADAATAMIGFEIVDSRFSDYKSAAPLHKTADLQSNGGFVAGPVAPGWRKLDLENIAVTLRFNGEVKVQGKGGHPCRDPFIPAVGLANLRRRTTGISAGQFATTGTFTGLVFAEPGDVLNASFEGIGSVDFSFQR
jgi:2-keto-4-pentenoate hydratase